MPLEVLDLRQESGVPDALLRKHGGWDRPELGEPTASVRRILADVREKGDEAVVGYTARFDGVDLSPAAIRVSPAERDAAASRVAAPLRDALEQAAASVRAYHAAQRPKDWTFEVDGRRVGQTFRPIRRVGMYAPVGLASTVIMLAVPAEVAGVPERVLCTPPEPSDELLCAATVAGVDEIYRIGGAQAIGAMAFGTASVPACDKIVGPGNVYVTLAKREVFGIVGIDALYGPSESLVVVDGRADPVLAAAELITQAEHAADAAAILVTTSEAMLERCLRETEEGLRRIDRADVVRESLATNGLAILVRDLDQAAAVANALAPEHLCVQVADPDAFAANVTCAGTILLGDVTAATLSDYCAGPSHVLPTARSARFSSGLSVHDFLVAMNTVAYTIDGVRAQVAVTDALADAEGMGAHRAAVRARIEPHGV